MKEIKGLFFRDINQDYVADILHEIYIDKIYTQFLEGKENLVIMDCGANQGLFTLYASQFAKKVYSVEPSKEHVEVIKEMVRYNDIGDKVEIIQKAISHEDKEVILHHNKNTTMYSLKENVADKSLGTEKVEGVRLDTLFERYKIKHVDFLKMDVEGVEVEIIGGKGFENVADKIDAIVVEWHTWSSRSPAQVFTTLNDYGFKMKRIPSKATLFGGDKK